MDHLRPRLGLLLAIALALAGTTALAQDGNGVLDDKDAARADPAALQAEQELFETIRQGIAVSIAQCELAPKCNPTVAREELRRIVGKLDTRLDTLTARHTESGDAALEPIMVAYVETRDGYNEFLSRLDSILPPEDEFGEPLDLGELPEEFDVFSDADADLTDDTDEVPAAEAAASTEQQ